MTRTINDKPCKQIQPSDHMYTRGVNWIMNSSKRDHPGYWSKMTKRIYVYVEHTGDITFWREAT